MTWKPGAKQFMRERNKHKESASLLHSGSTTGNNFNAYLFSYTWKAELDTHRAFAGGEMKQTEREREFSTRCFTFQMPVTAGAEPGWSQETWAPSGTPTWLGHYLLPPRCINRELDLKRSCSDGTSTVTRDEDVLSVLAQFTTQWHPPQTLGRIWNGCPLHGQSF